MSSEYRRAKRRKVEDPTDVLDTMTETVVGHVSDLSETGMLLILHQALVSDGLYQFRFKLTDPQGRDHAIMVGAHELWSDQAAAPGQVCRIAVAAVEQVHGDLRLAGRPGRQPRRGGKSDRRRKYR